MRSRCDDMSSSVLSQRLRELGEAGLVTKNQDDRYELTDIGASLHHALAPLDDWAEEWSAPVDPG
ncbi:MAG: winged helix-turn-helix transcriptional regulator [Actinomycetota bacterium]